MRRQTFKRKHNMNNQYNSMALHDERATAIAPRINAHANTAHAPPAPENPIQ